MLKRINNDTNGNPRYVVHFLSLLNPNEQEQISIENRDKYPGAGINAMYEAALKKSRVLGGKKYHTKNFGGGIAFQSHNPKELETAITKLEAVQA